jgi:hypothetical protein
MIFFFFWKNIGTFRSNVLFLFGYKGLQEMVVHNCSPCTSEAEARGSWVQGQPGLQLRPYLPSPNPSQKMFWTPIKISQNFLCWSLPKCENGRPHTVTRFGWQVGLLANGRTVPKGNFTFVSLLVVLLLWIISNGNCFFFKWGGKWGRGSCFLLMHFKLGKVYGSLSCKDVWIFRECVVNWEEECGLRLFGLGGGLCIVGTGI